MPRTGKHPLKLNKTQYTPQTFQRITICTIVHIPMMSGYWADSLKVLELFFDSLFANTDQAFDLMVFDNASCPEVQDYLLSLQRAGKIQFLTLSRYNLKKLGAMDFLFTNAPGEYIAFADSDVYFLPGWLEESLAVLQAFPKAGQVTALPTVDSRGRSAQNTLHGLETSPDLVVECGQLIPEAYIEAHRLSIGREKDQYMGNTESSVDIRITRNNVSAFVCAQDFEFLTRREVIRRVLPLQVRQEDEFYDSIYSPVFEAKVNENGWWRLSTTRYLVHHMGNRLPDLESELAGIAVPFPISQNIQSKAVSMTPSGWQKRLLGSRLVRGLLKRMYTWTYSMLFEAS